MPYEKLLIRESDFIDGIRFEQCRHKGAIVAGKSICFRVVLQARLMLRLENAAFVHLVQIPVCPYYFAAQEADIVIDCCRFSQTFQCVGLWYGVVVHYPYVIAAIFYGKSSLLRALYYFPYVQWVIIAIFIVFTYIALQSTKQDEQNRVWIGLAKETAHQLGTPTSSLLGWIEYLRTQNVDPMVVEEMNKDMAHLLKIVDHNVDAAAALLAKIDAITSNVEVIVTISSAEDALPESIKKYPHA